MKKNIYLLLITMVFAMLKADAQEQELQQLALDYQKLAQLKNILSDMEKGYAILNEGYNAIKGISQGSFDLHNAFLTGLLGVSPAVRRYQRVADIILQQTEIVTEYKSAYRNFKRSGGFSREEITYLGNIYSQLFNESLHNLEELANVLTAGKLRMSDAERLQAIDRIHADTENKLVFLRSFNRQTTLLSLQRTQQLNDNATIRNLYHH